jgi:NADH:ubiquinone oxidoreductase subunit 3 (subunit A)
MLVEAGIALLLIISVATIIYLWGRHTSPKTFQTEGERASYACGERVSFPKLKVNVSLYKYLIYFVVLDSSIVLIAFASYMSRSINMPLLLVYLFMMLASGLLLFDGGKD